MYLSLVDAEEEILIVKRVARYVSPYSHNALEIVWVTRGALELGVGQELYHMEDGDVDFVFPNIIHHYRVFMDRESVAIFIKPPPFVLSTFDEILLNHTPEYPIVKTGDADGEMRRTLGVVMKTKQTEFAIIQAYLQAILTRRFRNFRSVEKRSVGSDDPIYQTAAYMPDNSRNTFSSEDMAKNSGTSKYALSRILSETFHSNFKQYLDGTELGYVRHRLENTEDSITNICLGSGFDSQRVLNRVFRGKFRASPTKYRRSRKEKVKLLWRAVSTEKGQLDKERRQKRSSAGSPEMGFRFPRYYGKSVLSYSSFS